MRRPTEEETKQILAAIRAGGMHHVAAEAAGVEKELWRAWVTSTESDLVAFQMSIQQAHAQARLTAEMAVRAAKPLMWLTKGPGRTAPGRPGWGDRLEVTGADGGALAVTQVEPELDYERLTTQELEELHALEARREQLRAKAVAPSDAGKA
jgi:hypothetical protein